MRDLSTSLRSLQIQARERLAREFEVVLRRNRRSVEEVVRAYVLDDDLLPPADPSPGPAGTMLCGCGAWRELDQMVLRVEGGDQHEHYIVECIDCASRAGPDTDALHNIADLFALLGHPT